jgi:hypothetical protein
LPVYYGGKLGLAKVSLRQSRYQEAVAKVDEVYFLTDWNLVNFSVSADCEVPVSSMTKMKFYLWRTLARTALGKKDGMQELKFAAKILRGSGRYVGRSGKDPLEELVSAIYYELIQRNMMHRCSHNWLQSAKRQPIRDWKIPEGCRSFWDWLDEPEAEDSVNPFFL